jgi:hypothetical protein
MGQSDPKHVRGSSVYNIIVNLIQLFAFVSLNYIDGILSHAWDVKCEIAVSKRCGRAVDQRSLSRVSAFIEIMNCRCYVGVSLFCVSAGGSVECC